MNRALVTGGTGVVGRAVCAALASRGLEVEFTWNTNEAGARELEAEGCRGHRVDLRDVPAGFAASLGELRCFVHAAGIASDDVRESLEVNVLSALQLARELAFVDGGSCTLVGASTTTQAMEIPLAFAVSQGASTALTMSLGRELAPRVRVNMVALGLLESGLSEGLDDALIADFLKFSALRRRGRPEEAANAIAWLALNASYMNGRVLPVSGGI